MYVFLKTQFLLCWYYLEFPYKHGFDIKYKFLFNITNLFFCLIIFIEILIESSSIILKILIFSGEINSQDKL